MKNISLIRIVLIIVGVWTLDCVSAIPIMAINGDNTSVVIVSDSLGMQVDSLSIRTVADSTSLKDTVAVDIIPDSLIIGRVAKAFPRKYFKLNERSEQDCEMLKLLYKKGFDNLTPPAAVYDKWRLAFISTKEKSLDMYIDGMCIILSKIETDTIINGRYDRLSNYRDELMELYEMAIENLDDLNAQIDKDNTKDTLSVAKLRGMQLKYYVDISIADSIYNSDTLLSRADWENIIFLDREHEMFIYPRYKEILLSNDLNIDMTYLTYFIKSSEIKIGLDREIGLSQSIRQENFNKDCELVRTRAEEIFASVDPYEMYNQELTNYEVFNMRINTMEEIIRAGNRRFISNSDYPKLEEYYTEKFKKEGSDMAVWNEILNSPLVGYNKSKIYVDVLRRKYENEPTYELARRITNRLSKNLKDENNKIIRRNVNDAFIFAQRAIEFKEFTEELPINQYLQYLYLENLLSELGGHTKARIEYIKKARKLFPEYPETYYLEGYIIYSDKRERKSDIVKSLVYCLAYDYFEKALKKLKELDATTDSAVNSRLTVEDIQKYMENCKKGFSKKEDVFMEGFDANAFHEISFTFGTYSVKFKFSN